jgi:hypothetical protein
MKLLFRAFIFSTASFCLSFSLSTLGLVAVGFAGAGVFKLDGNWSPLNGFTEDEDDSFRATRLTGLLITRSDTGMLLKLSHVALVVAVVISLSSLSASDALWLLSLVRVRRATRLPGFAMAQLMWPGCA